jgi:hypothetical protein
MSSSNTNRQPSNSSSTSSSSTTALRSNRNSVTPVLQQQQQQAAPTNNEELNSKKVAKIRETSTLLKFKKRPISANADSDNDLNCPICFDIINIAHVTKCGHSFCQTCITKALEHAHRCPKCNTPCNITKDIFPNFARML